MTEPERPPAACPRCGWNVLGRDRCPTCGLPVPSPSSPGESPYVPV